jgi:hypothetical protein
MAVVSIALLIFVYCPMWLSHMHKKAENKMVKMQYNIVYIFMLILGCAFIFKFQHWPGGNILLQVSAILFLILIPVLWISASKQKGTEKEFLAYHIAIIFIAGGVLALYPAFMGPSKVFKEMMEFQSKNAVKSLENTLELNNVVYDVTIAKFEGDTSGKTQAIMKLHKMTGEMCKFIGSLQNELLTSLLRLPIEAADTLNICNAVQYDYLNTDFPARIIWHEDGKLMGNELFTKLNEYNATFDNISNKLGINNYSSCLNEQLQDTAWVITSFQNKPTLHVLYNLNGLQRGILNSETMLFMKL